jgi:integrase
MIGQFKEFVVDWISFKSSYVKESTICVYETSIKNHLTPFFGDYEICSIGNEHIQQWVDLKSGQHLGYRSVHDLLILLTIILKHAHKLNKTNLYEIDVVVPLRPINKSIDVLKKADENKLINYLIQNFSFKNLGILICLYTGLRIGEICGLKWSDISEDVDEISISRTLERVQKKGERSKLIFSTPKTANSKRSVPISSDLKRILKPLLRIVNQDCFVLSNELNPVEPRTYRNFFNRLLIIMKIPFIKFHCLRHTFATRCVEANIDYKTISVILGHANISITMNLYVHPNLDQKKACIEKMVKSLV